MFGYTGNQTSPADIGLMIQVVGSTSRHRTTDDVMTVTRATPSSRRRRTLYTARATLHCQCQRSSRGPRAPADRPQSSIT